MVTAAEPGTAPPAADTLPNTDPNLHPDTHPGASPEHQPRSAARERSPAARAPQPSASAPSLTPTDAPSASSAAPPAGQHPKPPSQPAGARAVRPDVGDADAVWRSAVKLAAGNRRLRSVIQEVKLVSIEGSTAILHTEPLMLPVVQASRDDIAALLSDVVGSSIRVEIAPSGQTRVPVRTLTGLHDAAPTQPVQREAPSKRLAPPSSLASDSPFVAPAEGSEATDSHAGGTEASREPMRGRRGEAPEETNRGPNPGGSVGASSGPPDEPIVRQVMDAFRATLISFRPAPKPASKPTSGGSEAPMQTPRASAVPAQPDVGSHVGAAAAHDAHDEAPPEPGDEPRLEDAHPEET
ncbi:MAG: hypothetical protein SFZ23_00050 [Planctomycetota bacterium]|nr:hypothetical protein [Planctomycetota bacterium]